MIKIELNLKKGELTYSKNGKCLGVACQIEKGEDIEYKIAVTFYWSGPDFNCQILSICLLTIK